MPVNAAAHLVRIHIDREVFESPDPTTGKALYELAKIPNRRELFREMQGNHEDELVPRDDTVIDLKKGDHFYSQRAVTISVNGEPYETTELRLSFEELAAIAFPIPPTGQCIEFTITYRDGPPANPKGTLTAGHSVKIKNRMKFDVTATDRS